MCDPHLCAFLASNHLVSTNAKDVVAALDSHVAAVKLFLAPANESAVHECVCVGVCKCVRERESVCVCVCVRERERERERKRWQEHQ